MKKSQTISTKNGDSGFTNLYDGTSVKKNNLIIITLGSIDELNSCLGLIKLEFKDQNTEIFDSIEKIQNVLFYISSELASKDISCKIRKYKEVEIGYIQELEKIADSLLDKIEIKNKFILPGVTKISAKIDIARTITRRAESNLVGSIKKIKKNNHVFCIAYLNRLSDYLFILARYMERNVD